MKKSLSFLILAFSFCTAFSVQSAERIDLLVSSRVDTSSAKVEAILDLYENYLNSRPDSIYDNPYWNKVEKSLYTDFDFSRQSLFQGGLTPNDLCHLFPPFVMSVESIGEKYQIRVMFSSSAADPKYAGSKVWCIQKLNAIKENGHWVLENLIVELSQEWSRQSVGYIDYIYPATHNFDQEEAKQSAAFCEDIITRFNQSYNSSFTYYVTSSIDEMGLLENFDYYFVGSTTGKAREGMVLTAKGNEFYPHELVHKLLPYNPKRGFVIEEGLATFLGTKQNETEYAQNYMAKLAHDLQHNSDKVNFRSVVSQEIRFNGYQTAYAAGAVLCEIVYDKRGDEGLRQLIEADTSSFDKIVAALMHITGLSYQEVVTEWNQFCLDY